MNAATARIQSYILFTVGLMAAGALAAALPAAFLIGLEGTLLEQVVGYVVSGIATVAGAIALIAVFRTRPRAR